MGHPVSHIELYIISNISVAYFISIAMGCIYTEAKNYPREPAAHVAISKFLFLFTFLYLCYRIFLIIICMNENILFVNIDDSCGTTTTTKPFIPNKVG